MRIKTGHRWFPIWLSSLALILAGTAASPAAAPVNFSREVLPVLSDNCYKCHGPDEKARKGKLRFDTQDGAFRLKDGKGVIVPGKSAESELVRRITSPDPKELMPPPESERKLTSAQISLLKRWVDEGAHWSQHWALIPPKRPELPAVKNTHWPRNDIDRFILARLEKEQLRPAPEARKETLIRRVSLDLTGLPPTLEQIDAFLSDKSPKAYERLVDRLLASPHYGERMAIDWLEVARFADTHGYQNDRYRPVWPWRDWVIKAFNQNLPFDKFATWQLAGDLLPNPTREQRLATVFNRLHLQNEEGGIVEEEYRVTYVVDRVNTFGTAFLGLTMECSRCHDHKFDPLTQRDFYSLFSFFQNIDESGQTDYFNGAMPVPTLLLSKPEEEARINDLRAQITGLEGGLKATRETADGFDGWLAGPATKYQPAGLVGSFSFDEIVSNKVANAADPAKPGRVQEGPTLVPGKSGQAAQLSGDNGFTFPGLGHFTAADPFSLCLWLQTPSLAPRFVVVHHSKAPIDAASRGYELLLEDGRVSAGLHHTWPGSSLKVITREQLPTNEWVHVAMTYDGSGRAAGLRIFLNGAPAAVDVVRDGLGKDITYDGGEPDLTIGFRFRDNGFQGRVDDFLVFNRELRAGEVAHFAGRADLDPFCDCPTASLPEAKIASLRDFYATSVCEPALKAAEELRKVRTERNKLVNGIPEIMVMQEMPRPKPAYVLKRGAYDAHLEQVFANTPAALPPFPADQPRNRLGLARWLFAPDFPLTSRVTVNRAWQMMFGRGIVESSDNFGRQGAYPSHPELLDWLAREFADNGWDVKRLLKLIALSATYRQSSQAAPELLARDPANELLARGPARRLTAEMLRDQALAVSGLLAEKIGGPSVKPYQPGGLWEEKAMGAPHYNQGTGEDLYRRSLYTYWKRTVPPPSMITFDAGERNICTVRRQTTSTPLQALTLLNDTQIIEASRKLGEGMLKHGGTALDDQVQWVFRTVTGLRPSSRERAILKRLFTEQREIFLADPKATAALLATGESKPDPALPVADLAAGAVLAEAILNHDAAVMRR